MKTAAIVIAMVVHLSMYVDGLDLLSTNHLQGDTSQPSTTSSRHED
jgi:hypothetical protein